jgi:hypothetical protein
VYVCKFNFIIFEIIYNFPQNSRLCQIQIFVSPNTVLLLLDQFLNSIKSYTGLRKMIYNISNMIKLYLLSYASQVQISLPSEREEKLMFKILKNPTLVYSCVQLLHA